MKKFIRLIRALTIFLMMVFSIGSAQDSSFNHNKLDWNLINFDLQETNRDSLVQWQERVVLHIANEYIEKDNIVFFKGYLTTGVQQNRYSPSNVLNIELLDVTGAIIKRQFHRIVDGMVIGNLELPKNTKPGKYYVRAYTRWMQNYGEDFYAKRQIWIGEPSGETEDIDNKSDILIFPEGGTLLSGHENRVVFKTTLSQASKVGQVGRVLDDKKQEVATVINYAIGIGTTIFKPLKDKIYQLELENGAIYPIPKAEIQGFLLHVNNLEVNKVKIRVTASSEVLGTEVTLVGTSGGIRYFENQLDFKDRNILDIDLSKKNIPYGIFTLKLVDNAGTELARRPIWIDGNRLYIDIKSISSNMDENIYKVKVTDKNNSPIKTQLALSVNRYEGVMEEYSIDYPNLFAYAEIVESDEISTDRKNRFLRDLNILVSDVGLENTSLDENSFENGIKYPVQKGLELAGHVYDLDNKLLTNTEIQIMAKSEEEIWLEETETDANGMLRLDKMHLNGNTTFVFRTKGESTKSRIVKLRPLNERKKEKSMQFSNVAKKQELNNIYEPTSWQPIYTTGLIQLEAVEVSENKIEERKSTPSVYGIEIPDSRIKYQNPKNPRSLAQMLSEIPGVAVSGIGGLNPSVRISRAVGGGPVLFVLDGMSLTQGSVEAQIVESSSGNSLRPIMNMIPDIDVERVELMIGADASMYGTRGAGGVILVYTRAGEELEFIRRKDGQLVLRGYEPILEFESYQRSLSKKEKEKSDILYWNPKLETDENGEAIIRFPALNRESEVNIEVSAITPDGKIGLLSVNF